jgi:hypothetical protein
LAELRGRIDQRARQIDPAPVPSASRLGRRMVRQGTAVGAAGGDCDTDTTLALDTADRPI